VKRVAFDDAAVRPRNYQREIVLMNRRRDDIETLSNAAAQAARTAAAKRCEPGAAQESEIPAPPVRLWKTSIGDAAASSMGRRERLVPSCAQIQAQFARCDTPG